MCKPATIEQAIEILQTSTDADLKIIFDLPHELGKQQKQLILNTLKRLQKGERLCPFTGAAGTGKTTTLKALLSIIPFGVTICAPTWKAARRATESLGDEFGEVVTVHRIVYAGADDEIEKDEEGNPIEEFDTDLTFKRRKPGSADVKRIVVIDEASMVGKELANELWTVLPKGTQVIAVGDPHQLPPVGDEAGFSLKDQPDELTDVFRQAEGSPVLMAATKIREEKCPFTYSRVADWKRGTDILKVSKVPTKWMGAEETGFHLAQAIKRTNGQAAAICGTHSSRVLVNDAARIYLGFQGRSEGPAMGEILIARARGGGLQNADIMTVLEVKPCAFDERFGDGWFLKVETHGYQKEIAVLRSSWENTYAPKFRGLIPHSIKLSMEDFLEEDYHKHGYEIARQMEEKRAFYREARDKEASEWLQAMWQAEIARTLGAWAIYFKAFLASVDTGYCVTCHSAQGSQWKEIFVIADSVDFIANGDNENIYRWSYTALTRAEEKATVVTKSKGAW